MKIYISGKISGLEPEDYEWLFNTARRELEAKGFTVLSPLMIKAKLDYEDYMKIDFAMIDVCDAVYFLSNYKDSDGAKREYLYALSRMKKLFFQDLGVPDAEAI